MVNEFSFNPLGIHMFQETYHLNKLIVGQGKCYLDFRYRVNITQTRPCNVHIFVKVVKIENFHQLDESTFIFRGVRSDFLFFYNLIFR